MMRVPGSRAAFPAFLVSIIVLVIACGNPAWCQEKASGQPSEEEMMKQMMELAAPDQHHKELGRLVGSWKTTNKMWMGPEPVVSSGTSTYEWILGGRYLQSKHVGEWSGMPFEGMGIDGYDKAKKEYFSIWLDTMGTGMMKMTGQPSADGKAMAYTGTSFDPAQGRDVGVREDVVWANDRSYTFTMYMQMPGADGKLQETKVLEIVAVKQ
jgi:hypothetical protein